MQIKNKGSVDLTIEDIKRDIERYRARITKAQIEIESLYANRLPHFKDKNRDKRIQALFADIQHTEGLIEYALEGIEIRSKLF